MPVVNGTETEANSNTSGPRIETNIGETKAMLLGTAHVSRESAKEVERLLRSGQFDGLAIELCPSRYKALSNPNDIAKMDLMQVIRNGKVAMVTANLVMGAYQQRIAEQFGIEPGAEMRVALDVAKELNIPLILIDRDIGTTLKRTAASLPWWKRSTLFSGLLVSLISHEKVSEDEIEQLKQGDILEATFSEFAHDRNDLFQPLIVERDTFMAARLLEDEQTEKCKNILAVIGAGHLKGMNEQLGSIKDAKNTVSELNKLPTPKRWPKLIPWLIAALVLVGFALGFSRSSELGWELVLDWVLINGGLSALGALIATAHPLTILTAFVAAPLTSLNPAIGAGMVTAATELWIRKPQVSDFSGLRHDTSSLSGWWKNRVSRTLLVFLFSTIGSAVGTYLAGFRIIDKLG